MRKVALLLLLVLVAGGLAAGCVRPRPLEYHEPPEDWRIAGAVLLTIFSCWLTHRLLNRLKGPGAEDPIFPEGPRAPWYLPPFLGDYTLSSCLTVAKWIVGGAWIALWAWFFGLLDQS